jgi:hypothetical protein
MLVGNRYEVIEPIGGFGIKVQRARALDSGKLVLVHRLDPASPIISLQALKLALQFAIAYPGNNALQDVVDDSGFIYIVTDDHANYISLMDWLPFALAASRKSATSKETDQNEATKLVTERGNSSEPALGQAGLKPGEVVFRPIESKPVETGEFTQIFQSKEVSPSLHSSKAGQIGQADAGVTAESCSNSKADPGEYTRLFRTNAGRNSDFPEGTSSREPRRNEDTGLTSTSGMLAVHTPPGAAPEFSTEPSEFTRVIQGGSGRTVQTAAKPVELGSVTKEPSRVPAETAPQPAPASTSQPSSVLEQPKLPELNVKIPSMSSLPNAQQSGQRIPALAIVGGALLIAALALILIFLLRK